MTQRSCYQRRLHFPSASEPALRCLGLWSGGWRCSLWCSALSRHSYRTGVWACCWCSCRLCWPVGYKRRAECGTVDTEKVLKQVDSGAHAQLQRTMISKLQWPRGRENRDLHGKGYTYLDWKTQREKKKKEEMYLKFSLWWIRKNMWQDLMFWIIRFFF